MQPYMHRQRVARWVDLLLALVTAMEIGVGFAVRGRPGDWVPWSVAVIVVAVWWMVSSLLTRVDASGVAWSFTWGWPGGRIPLDRIARAEQATLNLLELGSAGLHWTIWHGWLWNVGGVGAVEIFTTDGKRVTLGTDDPQGLLQAIERFRGGVA
jgi:hypothetical protein